MTYYICGDDDVIVDEIAGLATDIENSNRSDENTDDTSRLGSRRNFIKA